LEDEDITQELFLDSDSENKLRSHDSDQDKTQQDDTQWTNKTPTGWRLDTFCTG